MKSAGINCKNGTHVRVVLSSEGLVLTLESEKEKLALPLAHEEARAVGIMLISFAAICEVQQSQDAEVVKTWQSQDAEVVKT